MYLHDEDLKAIERGAPPVLTIGELAGVFILAVGMGIVLYRIFN